MNYDLPRHDSFGIFDAPRQRCSLESGLKKLKRGEFLFVFALGSYRINGPMRREIVALRSLYNRYPEKIRGVHVITSDSSGESHWRSNNHAEEGITNTDMDYQIGFDENDEIAEVLDIEFSPSLYILDHRGFVINVESIENERGFWNALARQDDPDFQTEMLNLRNEETETLSDA